jgi:P-type Cu+ transporter
MNSVTSIPLDSGVLSPALISSAIYDQQLDLLGKRKMSFYIEGIHCTSCLAILERIPQSLSQVKTARLNFPKSLLEVELKEGGNFAAVMAEIRRLGYTPYPVESASFDRLQLKNRSDLLRLGIAGACAGNIMLLSVSLYGGANQSYGQSFGWLGMALSLPSLLYAAIPFYQTSWTALKNKSISIDLPIVTALWTAFGVSLWSLLQAKTEVYFDSITMLIFLLLSSRYLLQRIQQSQLANADLLKKISIHLVRKLSANGTFAITTIDAIKIGDYLSVASNEIIPTDGILRQSEADIDMSLLTGESQPVNCKQGETIYAGTKNIGPAFKLEVSAIGSKSRIGQILEKMQGAATERTPLAHFADAVGKYFVIVVSAMAVACVLYFLPTNVEEGIRRALALVIIACPCVLALAVPLVASISISLCAKKGILIKNPDVLERILKTNTILLDKTGTLTQGRFAIEQFLAEAQDSDRLKTIIVALESGSHHPIARAILRSFAPTQPSIKLENWREHTGVGVSASIDGRTWSLKSISQSGALPSENWLGLFEEDQCRARLCLKDKIRSDSFAFIKKIKAFGLEPIVVSGDKRQNVAAISEQLNIKYFHAELSPEMKDAVVSQYPSAIMVGDGANDSIALKHANVGIAVHGSVEMSLQAADVFVSAEGIQPIYELLLIAKENRTLIYRNFFFTLCYNLVGATLALSGLMNPLWAALLMPISAATIFASSAWGTANLRNIKRMQSQ